MMIEVQTDLFSGDVSMWPENEVREFEAMAEKLKFRVRIIRRDPVWGFSFRCEFQRPDHMGVGTPFYYCEGLDADKTMTLAFDKINEWLSRNNEEETRGQFCVIAAVTTLANFKPVDTSNPF